jgi:hypothetical protein
MLLILETLLDLLHTLFVASCEFVKEKILKNIVCFVFVKIVEVFLLFRHL